MYDIDNAQCHLCVGVYTKTRNVSISWFGDYENNTPDVSFNTIGELRTAIEKSIMSFYRMARMDQYEEFPEIPRCNFFTCTKMMKSI